MKLTSVPVQTELLLEEIFRLTGRTVVTVMFMVFDVAGLPLTHGALVVMTQETASPLTGI